MFADRYLGYSFRYGTKLRYAAIIVNTTIQARSLGFIDGVPIRDDWEDFVNEKVRVTSLPNCGLLVTYR